MNSTIERRLNLLIQAGQQHLLKGGLKGLEKESLRITPQGSIAQTSHPEALGSALTHPYITTDYSEALIELITPPFADSSQTLGFLEDLHRFVYRHIGDELLLATSMPCAIEGDESIPIAQYGRSNIGKMKHVYRRGLAWRYGRAMQAIAGIHFNYSVNEALWPVWQELLENRGDAGAFIAASYFGMTRNIHRYGWLILYLFGSSPAFCRSFFSGREELASRFSQLNASTLYRPHATSLRMSDIGYRNDSQAGLNICFNELESYVDSLTRAINTPYPAYQRIGVKVDGEYRQLNANILQIENEYYSPVRPKQVAHSGEKPTLALKRRGVAYLELRSVDLCCFQPLGISLEKMRFLEVFLLFCLMLESPQLTEEGAAEANRNALAVACCGRTPNFHIQRGGHEVSMLEWGREIAEGMRSIAAILDRGEPESPYANALENSFTCFELPEHTPSAQVLAVLGETGESFVQFAQRLSAEHAAILRNSPLSAESERTFRQEAETSLAEQQSIEAKDTLNFDEFLQNYFAQG